MVDNNVDNDNARNEHRSRIKRREHSICFSVFYWYIGLLSGFLKMVFFAFYVIVSNLDMLRTVIGESLQRCLFFHHLVFYQSWR